MKKQNDYTQQFTHTLLELKKKFPAIPLGQHLSTAFVDYGDTWGVSDKEMSYALDRYLTLLEMDIHPNQKVEEIIAGAEDLTTLLQEDEYEEDI